MKPEISQNFLNISSFELLLTILTLIKLSAYGAFGYGCYKVLKAIFKSPKKALNDFLNLFDLDWKK